MKRKNRMNPTYQTFGVIFSVIALSLTAVLLVSPKKAYSEREKRSLASFPALSIEAIKEGDFMDSLEDFLADQFPLRDSLMKVRSSMDLILGIRESQDVFLMNDNSLAERFTMPSSEKISALSEELNNFYEKFGEGRSVTFLLAPTAVNINSDLLPENAPTDDQNAYIDRLFSGLPEGFTDLDVRELFSQKKEEGTALYYRTDHHWTTESARLAASLYLETIGMDSEILLSGGVVCNDFYGSLVSKSGYDPTEPDSITLYQVPQDAENDFLYSVSLPYSHEVSASLYDGSALQGSDPYQVFFGGNHPMITIETTLETGRKLLVIKDSYANCFLPFLVQSFDNITVVDPRYYYDDLFLLIEENRFTDILFLYNANTLSEDSSLRMVLENRQ